MRKVSSRTGWPVFSKHPSLGNMWSSCLEKRQAASSNYSIVLKQTRKRSRLPPRNPICSSTSKSQMSPTLRLPSNRYSPTRTR